MTDTLYDTEQVSDLLKLSQSTLRKWRLSGQGPAFVKLGRTVKYRGADIEAFMAKRIYRSTAEAGAATG